MIMKVLNLLNQFTPLPTELCKEISKYLKIKDVYKQIPRKEVRIIRYRREKSKHGFDYFEL